MTISGNWTLHFSWGGTGSYAQTALTFNADHTFSGSFTGKWRQQNGTVMLSFDGGPAKYGGTVNGNIGSGVMSTFSGLDGTWYLSKEGTSGILPEGVAEAAAAPIAAADGSAAEVVGTAAGTRQFAETTVASPEAISTAAPRRARTPAAAGSSKSGGKRR